MNRLNSGCNVKHTRTKGEKLKTLIVTVILSLGIFGCAESEKEAGNDEKTIPEFSVTAPAKLEILEQTIGTVSAEISSNSSAELSTFWSIHSAPSRFSMALIGGELDAGESRVEFETPNVSEDTNLVLRPSGNQFSCPL